MADKDDKQEYLLQVGTIYVTNFWESFDGTSKGVFSTSLKTISDYLTFSQAKSAQKIMGGEIIKYSSDPVFVPVALNGQPKLDLIEGKVQENVRK